MARGRHGQVLARRDIAHWTHNKTLFGTDSDSIAQPFLGEERLLDYVASLTGYIRMLRDGFPDTRFLAAHTMPQRNPRQEALLSGVLWTATRLLFRTTPGFQLARVMAPGPAQLC